MLLPEQSRELVSTDSSGAQDARERSSLDLPVPMDWDRDRIGDARMPEDVMTAAHSLDVPALLFKGG